MKRELLVVAKPFMVLKTNVEMLNVHNTKITKIIILITLGIPNVRCGGEIWTGTISHEIWNKIKSIQKKIITYMLKFKCNSHYKISSDIPPQKHLVDIVNVLCHYYSSLHFVS